MIQPEVSGAGRGLGEFLEPRELSIDRVPAYWLEGPEPATAVLMFRAGRSDELLARGGINHLVEHTALFGLRDRPYGHNGSVDLWRTAFVATGSSTETTDFLQSVAAALAEPPLERLDDERRILLTEEASRGPSMIGALLTARFGTRGPGTLVYPEYGLRHATGDDVLARIATSFTKENAAIWIYGPEPIAMELALRSGSGASSVELPPEIVGSPTWFNGLGGSVGIGLVGRRSVELNAAMRIAQRRALRRLRHDLGLSYTVGTNYTALSAERAHLMLVADTLGENVDRVREDLMEVVDALAESGPSQEELVEDHAELARYDAHPDAAKAALDHQASDAILGGHTPTRAELQAMNDAMTPSGIAQALSATLSTVIVSVPAANTVPGDRFSHAPRYSESRVKGKSYRPRYRPENRRLSRATLAVSDEGASFVSDRRPITVLFDRCTALLQWSDGSRQLYGDDGFRVLVDPKVWHRGNEIVELIERRVSADRRVPMGERPQRPGSGRATRPGFAIAGFIILMLMSLSLSSVAFLRPDVDERKIGGIVGVPSTSDGKVDCGGNSWGVVFNGGLPPMPAGTQRDTVTNACRGAARSSVTAGVIGMAGAVLLAAITIRRRWPLRRKQT